ncbi:hypothetical protein BWR59_25640 [Pseudomonas sp. Bc-h]|uniref:ATP-binding protein n=1 Tax=Pseudomonas sp. Bc-h TaxID=1943632 RepID=UPI0009DA83FE|nr:ATP-binding protein [Pseudomonas sp. Bc-h]OQR27635.1 hypothetical protein BWR59_25640 [Pseudomonas sp. Bc-h]
MIPNDPQGQPLDARAEQPFAIERFLQLATGAAAALAELHASGRLHRDIKPCNLLEGADGVVRLGGLELSVEADPSGFPPVSDSICGTLAYMAPEQARRVDRRADQRSDLYSLGMTFYEWLAGRLPFDAADALEWVYSHVARRPPALSLFRGDIPPALSQLVFRLIAKNPDERYQSTAGLLADLRSCRCQWQQFQDIPDLGFDQSAEHREAQRDSQARQQQAVLDAHASIPIPDGQGTLDLASVLKATQDLADETRQERLVEMLAHLQQQLLEENARRQDIEAALRNARARLAQVSQATAMGELAASIAHEINQPLASMVSNAAASLRWLSRETPNIEEALCGLRDIVQDGRRAGAIVNALQSLAQQGEQHRRQLLINDVIRHVVALTQAEVEQHRVLMTTHLTRSPLLVYGSSLQLQQVVLNLILNALDALSPGDQVLRRLSITSEVVGSEYLVVSIEDSGPGIEVEHLDKVFNAFFTTKDKGMGMGLAICRSIINAHGGQLHAMPARYGGATFVFTLPVAG